MRNALRICLQCLSMLLLLTGCSDDDETPAPECLQVEVVGEDCNAGWYILKVENKQANGATGNNYLGQVQSGFVTTDNLPLAYRVPGLTLEATLELNGEYAPRCVAITVIYPAVKVSRVCTSAPVPDSI